MLELLQITRQIWNAPSLKNIALIGAQHLMESTLELFRELKKLDLDPSQTFLHGKCYSSSASVIEDFKKEGFNISKGSVVFDNHYSFDCLYKILIESFLHDAIKKIDFRRIQMIIVLDDGGYLIKQLNDLAILNHIPIVGIEQTSAGIRLLEKEKLRIPVLNVARSKAKLELETPFIVDSSLNRFYRMFPKYTLRNSKFLILGNGVIGKALAHKLSEEYFVRTFDLKENFREEFVSLLHSSDVIFGCSGCTSLNYSDFIHLKKGAILASVSSSDREFDACSFRKLFPRNKNCRKNYEKNGVLLTQSGFPINFWGSRNNIKLEYIQITLSLLMSSVLQATYIRALHGKILRIDPNKEQILIAEFENVLLEKLKTA